MFALADNVKEMNAAKSYKYGDYGSLEHLLLLCKKCFENWLTGGINESVAFQCGMIRETSDLYSVMPVSITLIFIQESEGYKKTRT